MDPCNHQPCACVQRSEQNYTVQMQTQTHRLCRLPHRALWPARPLPSSSLPPLSASLCAPPPSDTHAHHRCSRVTVLCSLLACPRTAGHPRTISVRTIRALLMPRALNTPTPCSLRPPIFFAATTISLQQTSTSGAPTRRQVVPSAHHLHLRSKWLHTSSRPGAVPSPSCATAAELRGLVRGVYGDELWRRIDAQGAVAPSTRAASAAPLLHVTSLFQPRASLDRANSGSLYTLQVCGPQAPRHPLDRFALCLSRAMATEVVYSGKVLREEAALRCEFDAPFAPGMEALRVSRGLSPLPAVGIMTRAYLPGAAGGGVEFAHPLLDAHPSSVQPVALWHSRPGFAAAVARQLRRLGFADPAALRQDPASTASDEMQAELGALIKATHEGETDPDSSVHAATSSSGSSSAAQGAALHLHPRHPHKMIRFHCTHGARALDVVAAMARRVSPSAAAPAPFLGHLSVEAGPQVTRDLYGDMALDPTQGRPPPPVETLLLSVYRGPIPPEHYRRYLVYPSSHLAVAGAGAGAGVDAPPPTFTAEFLRRFYTVMSEFRCSHDPDWSFFWMQRKDIE